MNELIEEFKAALMFYNATQKEAGSLGFLHKKLRELKERILKSIRIESNVSEDTSQALGFVLGSIDWMLEKE